MPYYLIAANFWEIVNRSYMYSIGGVAGARTPNNAECFTAEPDSLWGNGFANGGQNETCATYNLLKLDRQLFMYDQTAKYMDHYERALYNHILASVAEDRPWQHLPRPAQPGCAEALRQCADERLHVLQRHGAREQHEASGLDLLQERGQRDLYVNLFVVLDPDLERAQGERPAGDQFPVCGYDSVDREGERAVRREGPRPALGDARILREDQRARPDDQGGGGELRVTRAHVARERHDRHPDAVRVLSGSGHGPAERRQHLLRPGPARG
jgi:hypothetical protein